MTDHGLLLFYPLSLLDWPFADVPLCSLKCLRNSYMLQLGLLTLSASVVYHDAYQTKQHITICKQWGYRGKEHSKQGFPGWFWLPVHQSKILALVCFSPFSCSWVYVYFCVTVLVASHSPLFRYKKPHIGLIDNLRDKIMQKAMNGN